MADAPPLAWLLGAGDRRRRAWAYWVRDTLVGARNAATHHALRLLPIDACSACGAALARWAPRRYGASDARARGLWRALRHNAADGAAADGAMRYLWRNIGRTMAEYSVLDRIAREGRVEVERIELLRSAQASGRPLIVAGLHLGNWELIGPMLGRLGSPVTVIYLVPPNRIEHRLAVRVRERCGMGLIPGVAAHTREAVRVLERGGTLLLYIDELARGRVHAPLFGRAARPTGNISYAARMAVSAGAVLLPAYCVRLGDAARFRLGFLPPVVLQDGAGDPALAANVGAINAAIEPVVAAHLDQWFYALDFQFDA